MLEHSQLLELLAYDPVKGVFTWRVGRRCIRAGSQAGTVHKDGYTYIKLFQKNYAAHRLAWFYETGSWPLDELDHENTRKSGNSFENLRESSRGQNMANIKLRADNTSGLKGVSPMKNGKWRAQIKVNGKKIHLGTFERPADGHAAYCAAARQHFGEFARSE